MYLDRFIKLADLLNQAEALWRQRPFVQLPVPWETDWPELSAALRSLSREEIAHYESRPTEIPAVRAAIPALIAQIESLGAWPALCTDAGVPTLPSAPIKVLKRKWSQVTSFIATVHALPHGGVTHFVDWCSGKGHLGRALYQTLKMPVTCVEINPSLCRTGRRESESAGVPIDFVCCDVLGGSAEPLLDATTGAVALHACGYLNTALIQQGVKRQVPFMAIAPCCYQRIDGMHYQPLSQEAFAHDVPLTRHQLRLSSLNETMTTDNKRARRRREHAFRLGVDLLHRRETGVDVYCPLGPVKPDWLRRDFAYFAKRGIHFALAATIFGGLEI